MGQPTAAHVNLYVAMPAGHHCRLYVWWLPCPMMCSHTLAQIQIMRSGSSVPLQPGRLSLLHKLALTRS